MIVESIRRQQQETGNKNVGFDVVSEDYKDMVEAGIIDPAKVTRSAVENAVSIAGDDPHHRGPDHRPPREGAAGGAHAGVLESSSCGGPESAATRERSRGERSGGAPRAPSFRLNPSPPVARILG